MTTSIQEMQWVLRAQVGDREALEDLLRALLPSLRRYLAGLAGSADADDLLQNVFIIVIRKIGDLEDPAVFRAWTFRVASREAFRHLRKRRVWMGKHDDDPQLENLPGPEVRPVGELLQQLLAADVVSPASRAVLMLHFQEELSLPETAAILDIPLGTAKSRRAYGLAAIRRHVAGLQSKIRPTNGPAVLRTVEAHMATIREKRCTARSTRLMPIANA